MLRQATIQYEENCIGGALRERAAYNDLRVFWPPLRDLRRQPAEIREYFEKEYRHGAATNPERSPAGTKRARKAIVVSTSPG